MNNKYIKMNFICAVLPLFLCLTLITTIAASSEQPDYKVIIGEWIRSDGNYVIQVNRVIFDGSVDAAYFNPKEINVAEANVSMWNGFMKLYIRLEDEGYPGSTYTLYYYEEKDALAGFYYQAAIGQTYEVIFLREK